MLYFLITYAGTIAAIATAVLGALWGFTKWGGKTAVEQWLKRNYKAWELEAEKGYKEDFKRFESKLDAFTNKEQTRFELAHPDRVSAAKEIFRLCKELQIGVCSLWFYRSVTADGKNQAFAENLKQTKGDILSLISAPHTYIAENYYNVDENLTTKVNDFTLSVSTLIRDENLPSMKEFAKVNDIMNEKLKIIGDYIKELLGS